MRVIVTLLGCKLGEYNVTVVTVTLEDGCGNSLKVYGFCRRVIITPWWRLKNY
jgi:hypothetical protein